jgi:hypothetical protein
VELKILCPKYWLTKVLHFLYQSMDICLSGQFFFKIVQRTCAPLERLTGV